MAFTILVVDDSETIRTIIMRTLQIAEVPISKLFQASNGKEALEVLKKEWIDLMFVDINMPVMDGIELIDKIKEDDTFKDLAIVVISTEGSTTRINQLQEKGIKAYVRKPFTPEQVSSILISVLGDWNESRSC